MNAFETVAPAIPAPLMIPVISAHERGYRTVCYSRDEVMNDPALILNPVASLEALVAAAQSRASQLHSQLEEWTCVPPDYNITAEKMAGFLTPTAYELETLLEAVRVKLHKEKGTQHG